MIEKIELNQATTGQWSEANLLVALQNAEQSLGIRQVSRVDSLYYIS